LKELLILFQLHGQRDQLSSETFSCRDRQGSVLGSVCRDHQQVEQLHAQDQLGARIFHRNFHRTQRCRSQHRISNIMFELVFFCSKKRRKKIVSRAFGPFQIVFFCDGKVLLENVYVRTQVSKNLPNVVEHIK
jgi:hypothetical protein